MCVEIQFRPAFSHSMQKEILEAAANNRVIMMMGGKDTGKTTYTKDLANELLCRGYSVGIVDTDVGQSDIGPPATIGFGTVETVLEKLGDAVIRHLYFVGSVSPKGHLLPMITGTRKMLDKALDKGIQKILVDTTGLIAGQLGRVLKEHKIAIVNPDVIICLQKKQECEHILKPYKTFRRPHIIRCTPNTQCRSRSQTDRRDFREAAFRQYFTGAGDITVSLIKIGIFGSRLFSGHPLSPQRLTQLSKATVLSNQKEQQEEAPGNNPISENCFIWGESLGPELHLVASGRLTYQQRLNMKKSCGAATYIYHYMLDELTGILVGVLDKNHEFCALGILQAIDFQAQQMTIFTHAKPQDIAGVKLSTYKMNNA